MQVKTLIIGAGAAGLFCAARAGRGTLVVDHAKAVGEKIRISGGGRCNFTNLGIAPECYLGENPHFHKSALNRYTQWDFIDLVSRHGIAWHEKTLGQLFCDESSREIVAMLQAEVDKAGANIWTRTDVGEITHDGNAFRVTLDRDGQSIAVTAQNLVVATGGKSIPKMGATGRAYAIAAQFGHRVTETRAGLVPFTFPDGKFSSLAGVAVPARLQGGGASFEEALLFTHRGLSGPAVLQISSYWREGDQITVDLAPKGGIKDALRAQRQTSGRKAIGTELARHLPARLVEFLAHDLKLAGNLADQSDARLTEIETALRQWKLTPQGTEGYRTAEVTLGGVSTDRISSKTMESRDVPGLYFIGEALDVTGWLGGYNFQWAWSSAAAAGAELRAKYASAGP